MAVPIRILLYLLVLFAPLVLVSLFRPQTDHSIVYEIGKNFALLGFTILILQFVLAPRLKWIERPFGLDVIIQFHRYMGIFALALLLLHPFLLAAGGRGWSLLYAVNFPWYIWLARLALLILLSLVLLSLFRKLLRLDFQRWRQLHNILALVIIPSVFLHSWYAGGDLSIVPLRVLWVAFLVLSILLYSYHRVLRPKKLRAGAYRVIELLQETHDVWTVKLAPAEGEEIFDYHPGQFHFITLHRSGGLPVEEHPFTISSSPTQRDFISSTIKASGDFTATIAHTKPGDIAVVHGPFGRFSHNLLSKEKHLVFIAGGVGITPFMSMLRYMHDTRSDITVTLLYANKTQNDIIFKDQLAELVAARIIQLQVIHFLSQPSEDWQEGTGYLNGDKIVKCCGGNLENKEFYLCGPPIMTKQIIRDLRNLRVPHGRIHFEQFSF